MAEERDPAAKNPSSIGSLAADALGTVTVGSDSHGAGDRDSHGRVPMAVGADAGAGAPADEGASGDADFDLGTLEDWSTFDGPPGPQESRDLPGSTPSAARAAAFAAGNRTAQARLQSNSRPAEEATAMPADPESERAIISASLIDPASVFHALGRVKPEDFWDRRLGLVWQAITTLTQSRAPIDPVTVGGELRRQNKLDAAGGMELLIDLSNFIGSAQAMEHYATTVARIATVRRVLEATHAIQAEGYQRGADPDHVIAVAQDQLRSALDRAIGDDAVPLSSIVGGVFQNVLAARDRGGQVTGIQTNYRDFDQLMLGLHRTDLMILAARPAMGKTALALNIALNVASTTLPTGPRAGLAPSVLVFSLEMGREQLVQRLLSQKARVGLSDMRRGQVDPDAEIALRAAAADLSELRLFIDDTPALNTIDLSARAKRIAMREGLDLIVVDYLQLMRGTGGSRQSREQEISEISRALKGLAKELNVTVMALSQLNRGLESRADKRPIMSDLRESGAIEQDADIILFIYRDHVYNKMSAPEEAELIVAKHRAGPTGLISLRFDGQFTRFYNRDDRFGDHFVGIPAPRFG